ncbi:C6 finger domain protein [Zymoseptoria brevis]|uniref:C6 finger domain protein n=1 Tax=Zymoseptoria brevis TaxID=1047168 RepID=A0A0F4GT37_9PEZI|nr:C6 finger domain protein [Zymoseptoria brevis]
MSNTSPSSSAQDSELGRREIAVMSSSFESAESVQRRERAAIAAQACQTCRSRKSKCDEQRPKCGLCRRLNVDCQYREPLPTKKDKTMVHILDTLIRLENKFDNLALTSASNTSESTTPGARGSTRQSVTPDNRQNEYGVARYPLEREQGHHHLTVPHKIVLWPSIYIHLVSSGIEATSDLQYVLQDGTPWFLRKEMTSHKVALAIGEQLTTYPVNPRTQTPTSTGRYGYNDLTVPKIQEYCDAYFSSFNILSPILNHEVFEAETLGLILREGFRDGEAESVLTLFVIALGQVALDGVFERPISMVNGTPSGFRGGTARSPPGLDVFNEARRRSSIISTDMTLENVQILLLQATFFEASARHLDFWRCITSASMACQVLIKCQTIDWQTPYGDMLKRAYWSCVTSEDLYHLDLDLPNSGIQSLEDCVPLPYFHEGADSTTQAADDRSHFQYHFLAMIALRRLIHRIHVIIHESSATQAEAANEYGGPPVTVIREMSRQLESWRSLLPRPLQWQDSDKLDFPYIGLSNRRPNEPLFSQDQGPVPINHKNSLDLVTAQLRTRFYYARYVMYRPFIYKALHFPELMTTEDANCCALAIKSALLWPIAMAPPKDKKRLVPSLFAWTQNFMGILLILRMTTENECLMRICEEQVNRDELEQTVAMMIEWVRDVRQVDGIAEWSWRIIEPLFANGA